MNGALPHFFANDLGPDHKDISDGGVGDPHFCALHDVAAVHGCGTRFHIRGVGAVVGFGEAKTTDPLACCQFGQIFLTLLLRAVGVYGVHDQGALHTHGAAIATVHTLYLARHQAVADIVQTGAVVAVNGATQETHLAKLVHDLTVKGLVAGGLKHAGLQALLTEGVCGLGNSALVVAQGICEV